MPGRCPGQDSRNLSVSIHMCPQCGGEVEIFSDETRAKCPGCGNVVYTESAPTCIQWCTQARECLGEARWKAIMEYQAEDRKQSE